MVRRKKALKIVLGLNIVTVYMTSVFAFLEGLVVFVYFMRGMTTNEWGNWERCFYWLIGFVCVWTVSFLSALAICKERLIIQGRSLRITQGDETLYQCDVSEIAEIERERFNPLTDYNPGAIVIRNYLHPVPKGLYLSMSWISYKRVVKRVNTALANPH